MFCMLFLILINVFFFFNLEVICLVCLLIRYIDFIDGGGFKILIEEVLILKKNKKF